MTKVCITKQHIEMGRRYHPNLCPVALAVKDALKAKRVSAYAHAIYADNKRYGNTQDVFNFIVAFDVGQKCRPREFSLGEGELLARSGPYAHLDAEGERIEKHLEEE